MTGLAGALVLGALVTFVVLFTYVVYGPPGKKRRRRQQRKRRHRLAMQTLDPISLISAVEDSSDVGAKFSVVSHAADMTKGRLDVLNRRHGDDLVKMSNLERDVSQLERELQQTRRTIATGAAGKRAVQRLVQIRGKEMYGQEWPPDDAADTEWHLPGPKSAVQGLPESTGTQGQSSSPRVHPVPPLALHNFLSSV